MPRIGHISQDASVKNCQGRLSWMGLGFAIIFIRFLFTTVFKLFENRSKSFPFMGFGIWLPESLSKFSCFALSFQQAQSSFTVRGLSALLLPPSQTAFPCFFFFYNLYTLSRMIQKKLKIEGVWKETLTK